MHARAEARPPEALQHRRLVLEVPGALQPLAQAAQLCVAEPAAAERASLRVQVLQQGAAPGDGDPEGPVSGKGL